MAPPVGRDRRSHVQEGPAAAGNFVIDDYQTHSRTNVSSSGGLVAFDVTNLTEGLLRDGDTGFTSGVGDVMNGMTKAAATDTTRGVVFSWNNSDRSMSFEIVPGHNDLSNAGYLSFRACQMTRDALTIGALGDLTFTVTLRDVHAGTSSINIGAYGGGLEEPYQRTGCGTGTGWGNEFETVRLRIADFTRNASGLDLSNVTAVELHCGPSYGSSAGRIGLDDLEITRR